LRDVTTVEIGSFFGILERRVNDDRGIFVVDEAVLEVLLLDLV
jgi:hypothetical protein